MAKATIIGHRDFVGDDEWKKFLTDKIIVLIENYGVDSFYVEKKSNFVSFCCDIIRELKKDYPHVKLINVWGEYLYYNDMVDKLELQYYDKLLRPECFIGAGKNIFVKRNQYLIDNSDVILFYFNENVKGRWTGIKGELPHKVRSGTRIAYEYAVKKKKRIINAFGEMKKVSRG